MDRPVQRPAERRVAIAAASLRPLGDLGSEAVHPGEVAVRRLRPGGGPFHVALGRAV